MSVVLQTSAQLELTRENSGPGRFVGIEGVLEEAININTRARNHHISRRTSDVVLGVVNQVVSRLGQDALVAGIKGVAVLVGGLVNQLNLVIGIQIAAQGHAVTPHLVVALTAVETN